MHLRVLDAKKMCNSFAAGFYLRDEASYNQWVVEIKQMKQKYAEHFMFTVFDKEPDLPARFSDYSGRSMSIKSKRTLTKAKDFVADDEEFEDLEETLLEENE